MADTTKNYSLICPNCEAEFEHAADPAELVDGGDLIKCPECLIEFEWNYDEAADTLALVDDEDEEDEDDADSMDDEADDEDEPYIDEDDEDDDL